MNIRDRKKTQENAVVTDGMAKLNIHSLLIWYYVVKLAADDKEQCQYVRDDLRELGRSAEYSIFR